MGLSDSLQGRPAGYVFPPGVGRSRSLPVGPPRLLDRSFHARCLQPPRKARRVLACCFPTGIRLHPSRRTGHFLFPIEAESSSLALRLACLPMPMLLQMGFSIPRLLGYMSEQAIYMVNSFQFTRSARLFLAYRPSGSVVCPTSPPPASTRTPAAPADSPTPHRECGSAVACPDARTPVPGRPRAA